MSNYQTADREGHGLGYTVPQLEQSLYAAVDRARVAEGRAAEYLQQVNDRDRFIALDQAEIKRRGVELEAVKLTLAMRTEERDRLILAVNVLGGVEHFTQCPCCMADRTNGEWHSDDCPMVKED